jgi:hypothetical protein
VPDSILSHRTVPSVNPSEKRIGLQLNDLAKLFPNNANNFVIRSLEHLFVASSANEAAEQSSILRGAVGKLVMHKRGREHVPALAPRYKKSETRGQRRTHAAVVAKVYSDRRSVLDASEFRGKPGAGQS